MSSLVLFVGLALAPTPANEIDFDGAVARAARTAPLEAVGRAARALRETRPGVGPLAKNPTLTIAPALRFAPSDSVGPEGQVGISVPLDLAGLSSARRAALASSADELEAAGDAERVDLELSIARAWVRLRVAQDEQVAADRDAALVGELASRVERMAAAGEATSLDLLDAVTLRQEAELVATRAEGEAHDRALELASLAALPIAPLPRAVGALPAPGLPGGAAAGWGAGAPRARAAARAAEAARARAEEARAEVGTELVVGALVQKDGPDAWAGFVTFGLTLPVVDGGEAGAREHEARALVADAERVRAAQRGEAELAQALHEVEHTEELVARLGAGVLPTLERGVATRERLAAEGEGTVGEVLIARRALWEARRRLGVARADHALARVQARRLFDAATKEGGAR